MDHLFMMGTSTDQYLPNDIIYTLVWWSHTHAHTYTFMLARIWAYACVCVYPQSRP